MLPATANAYRHIVLTSASECLFRFPGELDFLNMLPCQSVELAVIRRTGMCPRDARWSCRNRFGASLSLDDVAIGSVMKGLNRRLMAGIPHVTSEHAVEVFDAAGQVIDTIGAAELTHSDFGAVYERLVGLHFEAEGYRSSIATLRLVSTTRAWIWSPAGAGDPLYSMQVKKPFPEQVAGGVDSLQGICVHRQACARPGSIL